MRGSVTWARNRRLVRRLVAPHRQLLRARTDHRQRRRHAHLGLSRIRLQLGLQASRTTRRENPSADRAAGRDPPRVHAQCLCRPGAHCRRDSRTTGSLQRSCRGRLCGRRCEHDRHVRISRLRRDWRTVASRSCRGNCRHRFPPASTRRHSCDPPRKGSPLVRDIDRGMFPGLLHCPSELVPCQATFALSSNGTLGTAVCEGAEPVGDGPATSVLVPSGRSGIGARQDGPKPARRRCHVATAPRVKLEGRGGR